MSAFHFFKRDILWKTHLFSANAHIFGYLVCLPTHKLRNKTTQSSFFWAVPVKNRDSTVSREVQIWLHSLHEEGNSFELHCFPIWVQYLHPQFGNHLCQGVYFFPHKKKNSAAPLFSLAAIFLPGFSSITTMTAQSCTWDTPKQWLIVTLKTGIQTGHSE